MHGAGGKMYSRRTLLATVGTGILAGSFGVSAQQSARKTPRLGILLFNTPQIEPIGPLQEGLKAYGYEDGKTITIDYRFAEGKFERLPDLAADLVRLKPDVIFAYGGGDYTVVRMTHSMRDRLCVLISK